MMNSLLKKRLPGILVAGLVTLAVGAAGVTPATAASDASVSALTAKQKKAKAKALKACNKKRTAKLRNTCKRNVNKKYNKISKAQETPKGKTWKVNVTDPYVYNPNQLNIKVNDFIEWNWALAGGREPHDVTPVTVPSGVSRGDFQSNLTSDTSYKFKRQFTKPGAYSFVCSIHFQMTMNVNVSR
ncbi:MAG: Copper-binding protein [Actinomycetota bacterium]|jgi:plastocyanin|nr:Copper-binding protein [Actinomycetota bacterium]